MKNINFKAILFLLLFPFNLFSQEAIKMKKVNGTYQIPCKVNGVLMNFVFDTGASDVSISLTEAKYLIKNNLLKEEDFISKVNYKIADGSIVEGTKIILKSLQIGSTKIKNVKASIIHNSKAPLLLGQSAISKLGKYSIEDNKLIIENAPVSNQELDKKYGYKNIKFDTDISKFKNLTKVGKIENLDIYHYKTNDKRLLNLFNVKHHGILLGFNEENKKLVIIQLIKIYKIKNTENSTMVDKMELMLSNFKNIAFSFRSLLGKPSEVKEDKENLNYLFIWNNKKTLLSFSIKSKKMDIDKSGNAVWTFNQEVTFSKKTTRSIDDF